MKLWYIYFFSHRHSVHNDAVLFYLLKINHTQITCVAELELCVRVTVIQSHSCQWALQTLNTCQHFHFNRNFSSDQLSTDDVQTWSHLKQPKLTPNCLWTPLRKNLMAAFLSKASSGLSVFIATFDLCILLWLHLNQAWLTYCSYDCVWNRG